MTSPAATAKRSRKRSLSRPAGPSRIHNKRQQKIVKMVDGYDSTFTLSIALRNVFLVWTLVGVALIAAGVYGFGAVPGSARADSAEEVLFVVRAGPGLLFILTALLVIAWGTRSRMNVKHLGKSSKIGVWNRLKSHLLAFGMGFMALVLMFVIPPGLARVLLVAGLGLLFYSQLWFHLLMMDAVRMLWRTSSPPTGQEEDVNHYVLVWLVSWIVFAGSTSSGEVNTLEPDVLAVAAIVQGVACVVSSITAAKLVTDISRRQDSRLYAIISNVEPEAAGPGLVTQNQISNAWEQSEGLLDLPTSGGPVVS